MSVVQTYVDACAANHIAPVKERYIIKRDQSDVIVDYSNLEENVSRTRERGQNKLRKSNLAVALKCKESQLCRNLLQGVPCDKENGCKNSHDIEAAREAFCKRLKTEVPPLGLVTCPEYEAGGKCRFGWNCESWDVRHEIGEVSLVQHEFMSNESNMIKEIIEKVKRKERKCQHNILLDGCDPEPDNTGANGKKFDEREILEAKGMLLRNLLNGKKILAPMTTVGNLPFRRLCIGFGAEVTMSEMALAQSICALKTSELALLRRHNDEKVFGLQIAGGSDRLMARTAELLNDADISADWIDLNLGCPLTQLHKHGAGCVLMLRETRLKSIISAMSRNLRVPMTVKCRTGMYSKESPIFHQLGPKMFDWGCQGLILHGRSAQQRYSNGADWDYITKCSQLLRSPGRVFVGNGDIFCPQSMVRLWESSGVDAVMIGRGALIKPWIFEEIRRGELWDISSGERMDALKKYCHMALYHWGSDSKGKETVRRFLLEHLSFLHRYIPVGLLERLPQRMNDRPPAYIGRDEMETMMSKSDVASWIKISEILLGRVPEEFSFIPKHKSSSYVDSAESTPLNHERLSE